MQTMLAATVSYLISTLKSVLVKWNTIVRLARIHLASSGPASELAVCVWSSCLCPCEHQVCKEHFAGLVLLVDLQQKLLDCFFLITASMDNPHKSWSEGRQKRCREGMGFWNSLKSGGSIGRLAGASLWARYWLCCLWEKQLGQVGHDSGEGWYPDPLEERTPL